MVGVTDTFGALPGIRTLTETVERAIWFGRQELNLDLTAYVIDSTTVDAGNTPTTDLRPGLIMGVQTADGNLRPWDPDAVDGTEIIAGVLNDAISMLDVNGTAEDKFGSKVMMKGGLWVPNLLIQGTAFTSHIGEHLAREQFGAMGKFFLSDEIDFPMAGKVGALRNIQSTGTTLTPTSAQNGTRFFMSNAASVTVTLPTLEPGLVYEFYRTGDEALIVASAAGDDCIVGNDLTADGVTFTTSSEHIGAWVRCESVYIATITPKWLFSLPAAPFGTGTATLTYGIQT